VDLKIPGSGGPGEQQEEEENYEPFDAKLAEKIRSLEGERLRLVEKVADLRRTGAGEAAEVWKTNWEERAAAVMSGAESDVLHVKVEEEGESEEHVKLDIGPLERWDDVVAMHERALGGLVELKSGMAETVGKLEEARRVERELGVQ